MFSILTATPAQSIQWKQTAASPVASLVLDSVKTFINRPLEDPFWDRETTGFIMVAQKAIEAHCQLSLAPSTWIGTLPQFYDQFRINKRPFASVEKIEYVDPTTGTILTADPTLYQSAQIAQGCGLVVVGDGAAWPDAAKRMDAVRITVKTGFFALDGTTPQLPADMLHALSMTVAELDANRGDEGGGGHMTNYAMKQMTTVFLTAGVRALLAPYTYQSVFAV